MASIHERDRGDGTTAFRVMFRIDKKQVGETFDTRLGAEEFKELVERYGGQQAREIRASRSGSAPKSMPTVAEWCVTHVGHLAGITEGTRSDYLDIISRAIDTEPLGAFPVDALSKNQVAAWIRTQSERGLSGKTIKNRHGLLSAAMSSAVEEGLRDSNPCRGSRMPETERKGITFLTHTEFAILYAHMPVRWRPLTMTLAGTGMRFGEATALQVRDVHLDDDIPNLRVERAWKWTNGGEPTLGPPKTRRGRRTISIGWQVVEVLRPLLEGKSADDLVFTRAQGGVVRNVDYREDGWLRALKGATAKVGKDGEAIPADQRLTKRPRIHDLRHSHASWQIANGRSLLEVQHRMGHESVKTTGDIYGHLAPDAQQAAADATEIALSLAMPIVQAIGPSSDAAHDAG